MQIFADVIQRDIETTNQAKMAGAIGAAMCVFVGSGKYKNFKDVNNIVKANKVFKPDPANFEIYNKLFKDYKNIYKSLKGAYISANSKRFNIN